MALGGNRRWISREEIAEIHDSIANKFEASIPHPESGRGWDNQEKLDSLRERAQHVRDTQRLGNKIGFRTA